MHLRIQLFLLITKTLSIQSSEDDNFNYENYGKLYKNLIPEDYIINHPPINEGKAVKVEICFKIYHINEINVIKQLFEADLYVLMKWKDSRLNIPPDAKNKTVVVSKTDAQRLWIPKVAFGNCKSCDSIKFSAEFHNLLLYPTKEVQFNSRFVGAFQCSYQLHAYPFDIQTCFVSIESYFYPIQKLRIVPLGSFYFNEDNKLPEFQTRKVEKGDECPLIYALYETDSIQAYDCVKIKFTFERYVVHSLVQMYIPSALIVFVSWVGFWFDCEALPSRVAVSITSLLALVTQFSNSQKSLPPVSYMKVLDIWMLFCILAVFMSMVELAIAYNYVEVSPVKKISVWPRTIDPPLRSAEISSKTVKKTSNKVDRIARIIFPIAFGIFNICYWSYVITARKIH